MAQEWEVGLKIQFFKINGNEELIKLYIDAIYYKINGSWEIYFD